MGGSGDHDPYRPDIGSGGGDTPQRDCTKVRFATTLQQTASAPTRPVGTILELLRVAAGGATVIAAVDDSGQILGTVVEELADLLRCTASGVAYVAEVTGSTHGVHTVAIRASDRSVAASGSYGIVGAGGPTTDAVALDPGADDVAAEIAVGALRLVRADICELRSLLRVGVPFHATVDAAGAVIVSQS